MPNYVNVIHGTSHGFKVEIEDFGLRSRPGKSKGTRIALSKELALVHASAFCAFVMMQEQLPPIALLCFARIEKTRIREGAEKNPLIGMGAGSGMPPVVGPSLVVPGGIRKHEISYEEVKLPMLFEPEAAKRALKVFEALTDRQIALVPGNTGQ